MRTIIFLALGLALAAGEYVPQRIIGGSETTIDQYPYGSTLLISDTGTGTFTHNCGGAIINNRSILSAAHCFENRTASQYQARVGSTQTSSGGTVYTTSALINHPSYNTLTDDNDVGILRIAGEFTFNTLVQPGVIAGTSYNLPDDEVVWAIGWGWTTAEGPYASENLQHVQIWTVNQDTCVSRYAELDYVVTENMLCSGWLDVGGRDQCQGDSGSPLIHEGVIVGVCSTGEGCALARYPGINARVSRYTEWIQSNA